MICKKFDEKGHKMSILEPKTSVGQKVTFWPILGGFGGHPLISKAKRQHV